MVSLIILELRHRADEMIDQPQYMTPEALVTLKKRLRHLVEVRRPQVAERLRAAGDEGGDLNENADYVDAKEEQAFVEAEIARLEFISRRAQVIQPSSHKGRIALGSIVTVAEEGLGFEETYQLVSSAEANPVRGKISVDSPLGRALIGAKVGAKVNVSAPDGELIFVVKAVC